VFNGINGATGQYLVPPLPVEDVAETARRDKIDPRKLSELKWKAKLAAQRTWALTSDRDPKKLSEAGWGLIFPADADPTHTAAILDALEPLRTLRREQAGPLYKEYTGADGYRPGEGKDTFLARKPRGLGPGPVIPEKAPYYLLIVADPQSIPFEFQYELDVAFAVGRIYFRAPEEYARYAATVKAAETGKLVRPRTAAFFGVRNPNDRATEMSAERLVAPLGKAMEEDEDWKVRTIAPKDATKAALTRLLGGDETPAFLFAASHGLGFDNGDPRQFREQGALLCQDWQGPDSGAPGRDTYFAAEDLAGGAAPSGLIAVFFACYGGGTPYYDAFPHQAFRDRVPIAPRSFLAALPTRLLGQPSGGALAVVGHVERAWGYSIAWGDNEQVDQTPAFRDMLWRLRDGHPLGSALEPVNTRYAEIATLLSNAIDEDKYVPDPYKLAGLWTADHDARGYAVLGDPAVRLPVPADKKAVPPAPERIKEEPLAGPELPDVLSKEAAAEVAALPPPAVVEYGGRAGVGAAQFGVIGDLTASLTDALKQFGAKVAQFAENVSTLEVTTYTSDAMDKAPADKAADVFAGAKLRAITRVALSGQTSVYIPVVNGKIDDAIWQIHLTTVREAQAHRAEMLKTVADVLTGLVGRGG
jgi:hypothetical protein